MTEEELLAFLAEQRIVRVATTGPRGRPHLIPLWYVLGEGGELRGWTYAASQKAKNLERDARATLSVDEGVSYEELRGAMMDCDVQMERDPERVATYGTALFERYGDAPEGGLAPEVREMVAKQASKRVGLTFRPTRVVSWDHRKLGGTY